MCCAVHLLHSDTVGVVNLNINRYFPSRHISKTEICRKLDIFSDLDSYVLDMRIAYDLPILSYDRIELTLSM